MQHQILILGGGAREHALAWKVAQSPRCARLFIAPGNAGTAAVGKNVQLEVDDFEKIAQFCFEQEITLLVVGPELPLVNGIVDFFMGHEKLRHVAVVGPDAAGARLEGSKDFAKNFMMRHGVPTARYRTFTADQADQAADYVAALTPPVVLKADGLAAGKGVIIVDDARQAAVQVRAMLGGQFGVASETVVVEEFLDGVELSVFVLTDGQNHLLLPSAKDYKRVGEGDTGANTGGMGAVSPVPFADDDFMARVEQQVVAPTLAGLRAEGINYRGFLFIGLMKVGNQPYVIEYNVRLGDPEAEVILPRLENDLVTLLEAATQRQLDAVKLRVDGRTAAAVVLAAGGYPDHYENGKVITGLDQVHDVTLFHAGTRTDEGTLLTHGGRVLSVTALGSDVEQATTRAFRAAEMILFEGKQWRSDIGRDLR